jgi:SNF2 family DNA or RNA helicase
LTPRPYQLLGRDFLASRTHALLADGMRVGKTPQAILAADKVAAARVLVLCPAVACEHWRREWIRWSPLRGHVHVLGSSYPQQRGVLIASYDRARRNFAALCQPWDLIIADECHYAKNPEAARTKMVYGKKGLGWHAKRMWVLSGTPAPRHAGELWPMLRAFGATGLGYEDFVEQFCYSNPYTERILGTREERMPEVRAMLAPVMLRRTIADVAPELPGISYELMQVAPRVTASMKAAQCDAPTDPDALAAWLEEHAEHLAEWRIEVALAKAEPLCADIVNSLDARLYEQTVVFGHHTDPLRAVHDMLAVDGVRVALLTGQTPAAERSAIRDRFALGLLDVVVANITAAGTAIDLSAASHGYFLEQSWVPGDNVQAAHRLVSLDKAAPVTYDIVSWSGSFDDKIQSVLARRSRELSNLM